MSRTNIVKYALVTAALSVILFGVIWMLNSRGHSGPIRYVVPDGFIGKLRIVSKAGCPEPVLGEGTMVVPFDQKGYACVSRAWDDRSSRYHSMEFEFASGARIPLGWEVTPGKGKRIPVAGLMGSSRSRDSDGNWVSETEGLVRWQEVAEGYSP